MRPTRPLLLALCVAAFAAAPMARGSEPSPSSPVSVAARLEARLASGDGVMLPDAERELLRFAGIVDLADGDWPAEFLARAGRTVRVAVSPFSGCYEFFDESGAVFWTVVPVLPTTDNWVAPFRHAEGGAFPDDDLYAPWRLVDVWKLSFGETEVLRGAASRRVPQRLAPGADPATNLCFTTFSCSATNLFFTAAWPTNDTVPEATLDLYGSTNLSSRWMFLSSHSATTNPVSFSVECDSLPWYVAPTQHVHDATCESVTNLVASPLDGTTVYTNVFWSCATNRTPGEAGFFRLGTRHDTDGDGLFDAAELLVHGTNPNRLDSDGDGIPDGVEPSVWWSNPLWATNAGDVDFIVDIVAPTDGSAETVLTMDGLRIPLSPAAGSWYFSLPPGQIVSCSASSSGSFFVLWAGTPGGSFWNAPDSFETPFWTSGNIAGYHESGASSEIAVPVLSVEPDFGEPLRTGLPTAPSGSHLTGSGSVCVHGDGVLQRYSWSVAPAAVGFGRQPIVTGAVQLENGVPVIDVAGTTGERTGTFGFGPGYAPNGGTVWGELTATLAAHRCDATVANPYCSVCGCYEPLDAALSVSKEVLTLKHDNQATISIVHPNSGGECFSEGTILIRRVGEADWQILGTESDLDPWTARIAGRFELRGVASVGGVPVTTASTVVEVRFPSVEQIAADQNIIDMAGTAWFFTMVSCEDPPHYAQEYAFAIRLDTTNDTYVCGDLDPGPSLPPWETHWCIVDTDPYNMPESPNPTDLGAVYLVAGFHTHPSAEFLFPYRKYRGVGPSGTDEETAGNQGIPGIVMDYAPPSRKLKRIPAGHPTSAPSMFFFTTNVIRRATP